MRGSCWVHITYIYYYEQYTCTPWLTLPQAAVTEDAFDMFDMGDL